MVHVVCTRFNVGLYDNKDIDHSEWMAHRVWNFQKYAMRCMRAEEADYRDVRWLVLLDQLTPRVYKELIEDLLKEFCAAVFYATSESCADVRDTLTKNFADARKKIITTRLDNDDCFIPGALKRIREVAMGTWYKHNTFFIDCIYGYVGRMGEAEGVLTCEHGNPFISVATTREEMVFAWGRHRDVKKRIGSGLNIKSPQWVRVIHPYNMSNRMIRGLKQALPKTFLEATGL